MGNPTQAALAEADRQERAGRTLLLGAALFEALALAAALAIADLSDRTHLLAIVLAVLVYGTLTLGLVVVDARRRAGELRLLRALELLGTREDR
ncbi:MAG TPA: hypothetical protein VG755_24310 [Nannocystaceae bacterium]|nr:hypothetical protein [Nannocystaceae bacterium]